MICIKSIDVVEVDRDQMELAHLPRFSSATYDDPPKNIKIEREMVQGRMYRTHDGRELIIGMSKSVQDAIGLPYESFENEVKSRERAWIFANDAIKQLSEYEKRIKTMSFWNRLKALFCGIK